MSALSSFSYSKVIRQKLNCNKCSYFSFSITILYWFQHYNESFDDRTEIGVTILKNKNVSSLSLEGVYRNGVVDNLQTIMASAKTEEKTEEIQHLAKKLCFSLNTVTDN